MLPHQPVNRVVAEVLQQCLGVPRVHVMAVTFLMAVLALPVLLNQHLPPVRPAVHAMRDIVLLADQERRLETHAILAQSVMWGMESNVTVVVPRELVQAVTQKAVSVTQAFSSMVLHASHVHLSPPRSLVVLHALAMLGLSLLPVQLPLLP